jgi:hypothetical protein
LFLVYDSTLITGSCTETLVTAGELITTLSGNYSDLLNPCVLPSTYISTTGDNSDSNCGSISSPCKTIDHAITKIVEYGAVTITGNSFQSGLITINTGKTIEINSNNNPQTTLSQSGNNTLFNVTTYLKISNLTLVHNSTNSSYILLSGNGRVVMTKVIITANSQNSYVCSYSFFEGTNGNLQISNSSVLNFNFTGSNNPTLISGGENLIIYIFNSNFSSTVGPGGLIFGNGSGLSISLSSIIVNDLVSNFVEGGDLYGNFLSIRKANNISIASSSFINISGASEGGVLYFENINSPVTINNTAFISCGSTNYGGAIMFKGNVTFQIIYTNFTNCSAEYRGGAICSFSNISGVRLFQNCLFTNNSLQPSDRLVGIDIYDGSDNAASFYTSGSVINCSSNLEVGDSDSLLFAGSVANEINSFTVFDCYLKGGCGGGTASGTYVSASGGQDYDACGTSGSPCGTMMYAVNKTPDSDWVNILYDNGNPYYMNQEMFPGRTVLVRGISPDDDPSLRPIFKGNITSEYYTISMIRYYNQNSFTTLTNFNFNYTSNQNYLSNFVYVYADSGCLTLRFFFYLF